MPDAEERKEVIDSIIDRLQEHADKMKRYFDLYAGHAIYDTEDGAREMAMYASLDNLEVAFLLREIPPSLTLNDYKDFIQILKYNYEHFKNLEWQNSLWQPVRNCHTVAKDLFFDAYTEAESRLDLPSARYYRPSNYINNNPASGKMFCSTDFVTVWLHSDYSVADGNLNMRYYTKPTESFKWYKKTNADVDFLD